MTQGSAAPRSAGLWCSRRSPPRRASAVTIAPAWAGASPDRSRGPPAHLANELHALLAAANEHGPYILVGHSLAGKTVRLFAAAHPDEVAGLVLVDARSERLDAATSSAEARQFAAALDGQATTYTIARRLGIARLFGAALAGMPLVPEALAAEMAIQQTQPDAIAATTQEGLARTVDDAELAAATLPPVPLIVLASGSSMATIPGWSDAQRAMARLTPHGTMIVAEQSGHDIPLEQPQTVIAAIRQVRDAARAAS